MKFLQFFLMGFMICILSSAYAGETPAIYAIVIGVSSYSDTLIPHLSYADKDATDFYNFLKTNKAGPIPEENMVLLTNKQATRSRVLREIIDKFVNRARANDYIILYFAGHGDVGESDNTGYLLGYDSQKEDIYSTALSMDEITAKLSLSKAKMKISYIDACHAGLFKSAKGSRSAYAESKIWVTHAYNASDNSQNVNFTFETVDSNPVKTGEIVLLVEACKEKTMVLSPGSLLLK